MSAFVHLHVHSDYSPMQGVSSLETLCRTARSQGSHALAITDTNGLYGAIRFVEVAQAHGLRPILGAELIHNQHRAVLLVKDLHGYTNLCRLLSRRHCDADFDYITAIQAHRRGERLLGKGQCGRITSPEVHVGRVWKGNGELSLFIEQTATASRVFHKATLQHLCR